MKSGLSQVVGRRISGVIVKAGDRSPRSQVFLLFDDGKHYEFYCDDEIRGTGGIDEGDCKRVLDYLRSNDRDPVYAALSNSVEQKVADREVALGWIRKHLRSEKVSLHLLQEALGQVAKAGFEWRTLYKEARAVRPNDWVEPPAAETLRPE